jgi:hypothetical protein
LSIPFSRYTSFDYLGSWLYAVFGWLVAGSLFGESLSSKEATICNGVSALQDNNWLLRAYNSDIQVWPGIAGPNLQN